MPRARACRQCQCSVFSIGPLEPTSGSQAPQKRDKEAMFIYQKRAQPYKLAYSTFNTLGSTSGLPLAQASCAFFFAYCGFESAFFFVFVPSFMPRGALGRPQAARVSSWQGTYKWTLGLKDDREGQLFRPLFKAMDEGHSKPVWGRSCAKSKPARYEMRAQGRCSYVGPAAPPAMPDDARSGADNLGPRP